MLGLWRIICKYEINEKQFTNSLISLCYEFLTVYNAFIYASIKVFLAF